jgi:hypothetical protein
MVTIVASAASAPVKALSREPEMALYPVAQVLEPLRLWKLTSDVVSTEHRWIELSVVSRVAAVATINCFFQLLRLLNDDSLSHVVKILLQ